MGLDDQRKAYPYARVHDWSPADGAFVRICPVDAISVAPMPVLERGRIDAGPGANAANAVDAATPAHGTSMNLLVDDAPEESANPPVGTVGD